MWGGVFCVTVIMVDSVLVWFGLFEGFVCVCACFVGRGEGSTVNVSKMCV